MLGKHDPVNHPSHYTWIPGVQAIQICEQLPFCLGAAVKYIIRADHKGDPIKDIRKAIWNLRRELKRRTAGKARP